MPYIYSNRGQSVRWEDDPYTLQVGEEASEIYPDPAIMPPATSTPGTTIPSTNTNTTGTTPTPPINDDIFRGLRDKLTEYGNRIAALEAHRSGTNP